jgi:hypothetical protein
MLCGTLKAFLSEIRRAVQQDFRTTNLRGVQEADPATAAQNRTAVQRARRSENDCRQNNDGNSRFCWIENLRAQGSFSNQQKGMNA